MKRIILIIFALLCATAVMAQQQVKQSSTAYPLAFYMADSTTGAAKTGLAAGSITVTLNKNGSATFTAAAGTITEQGNGWYVTAGNATDTGTLGYLVLNASATGAIPAVVKYQVVAYDPGSATWSVNATQIAGVPLATSGSPSTITFSSVVGNSTLTTSSAMTLAPNQTVNLGTMSGGDGGTVDNLITFISNVNANQFDIRNVTGTLTTMQLRSGTAQAGGATTIQLDSGASATNDYYKDHLISLYSGSGLGQSAFISGYVGSTKVATIYGSWKTNPSSTSKFIILPASEPTNFGSLGVGTTGGMTLNGLTTSDGNVIGTSTLTAAGIPLLSIGTGSSSIYISNGSATITIGDSGSQTYVTNGAATFSIPWNHLAQTHVSP